MKHTHTHNKTPVLSPVFLFLPFTNPRRGVSARSMSLSDVRDMLDGIAAAGGLASASTTTTTTTAATATDGSGVAANGCPAALHLFALCASADEAAALNGLCFPRHTTTDGGGTEERAGRLRAAAAAAAAVGAEAPRDYFACVVTDWDSKAWLGLASFEAIAVAAGSNSNISSFSGDDGDSAQSCLLVRGAVTNWRKYFSALLAHLGDPVSSSSNGGGGGGAETVTLELNGMAGLARLSCPPLRSEVRLRRVTAAAAPALTLWASCRLARAWPAAQAARRALAADRDALASSLAEASARLEGRGQQQHGSGSHYDPHGLDSTAIGGSSAPQGTTTATTGGDGDGGGVAAAAGRKRPVSLINPQARTGARRAKGLRLQ